jgi:hypothetical protein
MMMITEWIPVIVVRTVYSRDENSAENKNYFYLKF